MQRGGGRPHPRCAGARRAAGVQAGAAIRARGAGRLRALRGAVARLRRRHQHRGVDVDRADGSPAPARDPLQLDHPIGARVDEALGRRAAVLARDSQSGFQLLSGLNVDIALAILAVSGPRSFSYTVPSWLTMKVMTPELP